MHEIKLQTPLSPGLGLYYTVWKQLRGKTLPPVAEPLPDFSGYDLVIVGAPVWMYTVATPMQSFLQQADFSGRPVAVFTTQGSNPGTFFADFKNAARNADIVSTIEFNNLPENTTPPSITKSPYGCAVCRPAADKSRFFMPDRHLPQLGIFFAQISAPVLKRARFYVVCPLNF